MFFCIYQTTNLINNKIYIGKHQTENLEDDYLGSGRNIVAAIEKYGRENFKKEILFVFETEKEMNLKEAELISEEFLSRDDVYNICPGGQGGFGYVNSIKTPEQIKNLAISGGNGYKKKLFSNEEFFKKRQKEFSELVKSLWETGVYNSDNRKKSVIKMREASLSPEAIEKRKETYKKNNHQQGNKNSQYGTRWITDGFTNKKILKTDPIPDGFQKGRILKK